MKGLKSTAQSRYDLRYHFVFIPRYRKRVLKGQIAKLIQQLIRTACRVNDWDIYELAVEPNHIHLYMGAQPKYSCSQIMKIIKGGSSKIIREEFPELDEVFWGDNATFWADGYFVKSVGNITDKVISNYITKQGY